MKSHAAILLFLLASAAMVLCPILAMGTCITPVPPNRNDCDIWIDTNGDGLPGPNATTTIGAPTSSDIWVDTKTVVWTAFALAFGLGPTGNPYFSRDTADVQITYHVPGGSLLPKDNFTSASEFVFSADLFPAQSGLTRLATLTLKPIRLAPAYSACVTPLADFSLPLYCIFVQAVPQPGQYGLFCAGTVSPVCYTIGSAPTATASTTWGGVKSLFR